MRRNTYVRVLPALALALGSLVGCSSDSKSDAKDAVASVNEACTRVREANAKLEELKLDEKGEDFMADPRVAAALKESAEATSQLASKVDDAAKADQGRIGKLRKSVEDNKALIKKIGKYVAAETIDEARDKARQMRELADIVGADACAPD